MPNLSLDSMPLILSENKGIAWIDAKYKDLVDPWSWSLGKSGYPCAHVDSKFYMLHRFVAELSGMDLSKQIDHIDRNKLNCTEINLRPATRRQNQGNSAKHKDGKNKYKGVCWHKGIKRYVAGIGIDNKRKHLGSFKTAEEAALAYNEAAIVEFGEFANLNEVTRTDTGTSSGSGNPTA